MRRALLSLLVLATAARADNLLSNPGFEEREGENPAGWHVYVEPQAGSLATVDEAESASGRWCVMLHNETPYPREPANNWSQNVLADLSGKDVALTGLIKTSNATSAELWLQCFQKNPWEVLLQKSTVDAQPVKGTHGWTPVALHVAVPEGTDFTVVRCVLKGTGTAWFDNITLETEPPAAQVVRAAEKPVVIPESPVLPTTPNVPQSSPAVAGRSADVSREDILAAQEAVRQANEALRNSNKVLADQLQAVREQLQLLREQIRDFKKDTEAAGEKTAEIQAQPPVPPLVPRLPEGEKKRPCCNR